MSGRAGRPGELINYLYSGPPLNHMQYRAISRVPPYRATHTSIHRPPARPAARPLVQLPARPAVRSPDRPPARTPARPLARVLTRLPQVSRFIRRIHPKTHSHTNSPTYTPAHPATHPPIQKLRALVLLSSKSLPDYLLRLMSSILCPLGSQLKFSDVLIDRRVIYYLGSLVSSRCK